MNENLRELFSNENGSVMLYVVPLGLLSGTYILFFYVCTCQSGQSIMPKNYAISHGHNRATGTFRGVGTLLNHIFSNFCYEVRSFY